MSMAQSDKAETIDRLNRHCIFGSRNAFPSRVIIMERVRRERCDFLAYLLDSTRDGIPSLTAMPETHKSAPASSITGLKERG